jgi:DNA replication protein DnaC
MFDDLAIARADGRLSRLMNTWARTGVLVIDDLLLRPLTTDQAADLLEVIEDRARLRATIVTSQLPVSHWHQAIGDPTIADAALDRLLEHAHRIELAGESMRQAAPAPSPQGPSPSANAASAVPGRSAPSAARTATRS